MSPQVSTFELIDHIEKLAAIETASIVKTEEGAERRRGRLDMLVTLTEWVKGRSPSDPIAVADYASGSGGVQSY